MLKVVGCLAGRYFAEENRVAAEKMLESIRGEFKKDLETLPWMDDATRGKAVHKLSAMNFEVRTTLLLPRVHSLCCVRHLLPDISPEPGASPVLTECDEVGCGDGRLGTRRSGQSGVSSGSSARRSSSRSGPPSSFPASESPSCPRSHAKASSPPETLEPSDSDPRTLQARCVFNGMPEAWQVGVVTRRNPGGV